MLSENANGSLSILRQRFSPRRVTSDGALATYRNDSNMHGAKSESERGRAQARQSIDLKRGGIQQKSGREKKLQKIQSNLI